LKRPRRLESYKKEIKVKKTICSLLLIFVLSAGAASAADDWIQQNPTNSPSTRSYHAMSYISEGKVLLFGGMHGASYYDDTWIYDLVDGNWTALNPTNNPSERYASRTVYISENQVLLFGGYDFPSYYDDTWVYNLTDDNWTNPNPSVHPSERHSQGMAYIGEGQGLLFGGRHADHIWLNDTWVYNLSANEWTDKSPSGDKPSVRFTHCMAYIGEDKVLLFGGTTGAYPGVSNDETWVYDVSENSWTQKYPSTRPQSRGSHSMAYIGGDKVLLFGGWNENGNLNDTWIYDLSDNTWTQDSNTNQPSVRYGHQLCETSIDGSSYMVLFGGNDGASYYNDTWTFGGGDYLLPPSLQFVLGNQTIGVGDSVPAALMYDGTNFKGCNLTISFNTAIDFSSAVGVTDDFKAFSMDETTTSVTISVAYVGAGAINNPGPIATLTFGGLAEGMGNIAITVSEVRGLTEDGDSQVTLDHNTEVTGYINVDNTPPSVDVVAITNDTVAATDDYLKNNDQVIVFASGTDLPAEFWAAGLDVSCVTANLSGFYGGSGHTEDTPNPFTYDSSTQQWQAWWTVASVACAPADGIITVTVSAKDLVDNSGNTNTDTIIADNTPPIIESIAGVKTIDANGINLNDLDTSYAKNSDTVRITATVYDDNSNFATISGVPAGNPSDYIEANLTELNGINPDKADYSSPNIAEWVRQLNNSVNGAKQITVTAGDLVGNETIITDNDTTINVDNSPPDAVTDLSATPGGSVNLSWTFQGTYETDYYGIRICRQSSVNFHAGSPASLGYPRYDDILDCFNNLDFQIGNRSLQIYLCS